MITFKKKWIQPNLLTTGREKQIHVLFVCTAGMQDWTNVVNKTYLECEKKQTFQICCFLVAQELIIQDVIMNSDPHVTNV